MSNVDTRQTPRDSLFLLALLQLEGEAQQHRIKVRNLSAGGMMAEGPVRVRRGALVKVELRYVGWVPGTVAWVQDDRFGIAFAEEVDPKLVRQPVAGRGDDPEPAYIRAHSRSVFSTSPGALRKI